jgi:hypothetical protein
MLLDKWAAWHTIQASSQQSWPNVTPHIKREAPAMSNKIQQGYLVIADISGYTAYLSSTELDHAHEILRDLLEVIINSFKPTLTIAKLEGDAVFAYAPDAALGRSELLLGLVESTYVAFRDRRKSMASHTTCVCQACKAIPTLDLKFIGHHGSYITQDVGGSREIVGPDVIFIHRLLKNELSAATGWHAYGLFTQQSLEQMGLDPAGMHPLRESFEHIGEIQTYGLDLHARYDAITAARRIMVQPAEAHLVIAQDFKVPPPVAWDWITDVQKRQQVMIEGKLPGSWSEHERPGGRLDVGATNHCAHGKSVMVEEIVDWRPFDYFTTSVVDQKAGMKRLDTIVFEPIAGGTRVHWRMRVDMPWFKRVIVKLMMTRPLKAYMALTASKAEEEYASAAPDPSAALM